MVQTNFAQLYEPLVIDYSSPLVTLHRATSFRAYVLRIRFCS